MEAIFDTCILIDYLNGIQAAKQEINIYQRKAISIIAWMEVMVGTDSSNEKTVRHFLKGFRVINIDSNIGEAAVVIRKKHRMKLPDAIIWATAREENLLLVTRNTKDFSASEPGIRVPYQL